MIVDLDDKFGFATGVKAPVPTTPTNRLLVPAIDTGSPSMRAIIVAFSSMKGSANTQGLAWVGEVTDNSSESMPGGKSRIVPSPGMNNGR